MIGHRHRLLAAATLASVALGALGAPVAQAGTNTCLVRNVTRDTHGGSFAGMVGAAHDGDRLTVRGTCTVRDVVIQRDVTIRGVGDRRAILHARGEGRVLVVGRHALVGLHRVVVTGGDVRGNGGGILNLGTLSLGDAVVRGNTAEGRYAGDGGGIYNGDTWCVGCSRVPRLSLSDSIVRHNTAVSGGGIFNDGTLTASGSVVLDNVAALGGGIDNTGTMRLAGSVVRRNTARYAGGGILNERRAPADAGDGHLVLSASVVRENTSDLSADLGGAHGGGGIFNYDGTVVLRRSSWVTENTAASGGGVYDYAENYGAVTLLREDSSVTGNLPDDCAAVVGSPAC